MKKINCNECGKEINRKAEICVHCGCRVKYSKFVVCLIIFILIVTGYYGIITIKNKIDINYVLIEEKNMSEKISGKYIIKKEYYNAFIDNLKEKYGNAFQIKDKYIDNDYEFSIDKNDVKRIDKNSTVNIFEDKIDYYIKGDKTYILFSYTYYLNISKVGTSLIVFEVGDNKLEPINKNILNLDIPIVKDNKIVCNKVE